MYDCMDFSLGTYSFVFTLARQLSEDSYCILQKDVYIFFFVLGKNCLYDLMIVISHCKVLY